MKRVIYTVLLVISFSLALSATAFAAQKTYHLDELGISVSLPDNLAVFTRSTKSNDPNLKIFGHTKESMLSIMESGNVYLNALDKSGNYEIVITMTQSPFEDFSLLSDTTLTAVGSAFASTYEKVGATYISSEIHLRNGAKFLKIYSNQTKNGATIYSLQFTTAHTGKLINTTLHSYSGQVSNLNRAELTAIVDSIVFDVEPAKQEALPSSSPAFTYKDVDSGTTFTVPENWGESSMFEEREYLDAKFISKVEESLGIFYTCEDIYGSKEFQSELTPEEKSFLATTPRADIDNSILTKELVAEMVPGGSQNISMVSYGGTEYFLAEATTSGTAYGLTISVPTVYAVHCENGYLYMFHFSAEKSSPFFKDFESLLSSVTYPPVESDASPQQPGATDNTGFSILVVFAVCALIFVMYWYLVKKKPVKQKETVPAEQKQQCEVKQDKRELVPFEAVEPCDGTWRWTETTEGSIMFCHKCGNRLMQKNLFCNKCGTKITKE